MQEQGLSNTNKAVSYIYGEEMADSDRATLNNRFYKLRQKLKASLLLYLKEEAIELLPEEEELAFIRTLLNNNQFSLAFSRLSLLEQQCWTHNIFELLPQVLDLCVRAIISIEPLDKAQLQSYLDKKNLSSQLSQTLDFILNWKYQMHLDIMDYPKMMQQIRQKIKPYKIYPRFNLLYHYVGFSTGIFWESKQNEFKSTLSRHFNQFNQLRTAHPNLPLLYTDLEHRKKLEMKAFAQEVVYWYLKGSFDKVRTALALLEGPNYSLDLLAESEMHNLILISIQAASYPIAEKVIAALETFQKTQYDHDSDIPYYCFQMLLYCKAYPNIKIKEPLTWIRKVEARLEKDSPVAAWVYEGLAQFYILNQAWDKATKILKHPTNLAFFKEFDIPIYTEQLVGILKRKNKAALSAFCAELEAALLNTEQRQSILLHYQGILKLARYFLDNW